MRMEHPSRPFLAADRLPPRYRLVLETLRQSPRPLSAYALLGMCRADGLKTPIQVYRILDRLIASRLVHRIEGMKAYIACQGCHASGGETLFAICEICGRVAEVEAETALASAERQAAAMGFVSRRIAVEITGRCQACAAQDG